MATDVVLALVTCPPQKADELATRLVEGRFAACVNVVPQVRSVYRWRGEVQHDDEALLLIKTTAGNFSTLKEAVLKYHPYELPEVIAVQVDQGHTPYLTWVAESTL